ncbi:MAG: class I SAM-dependent methyltransferase [Nitrospirota bacterium]|nr:class I SAM-dependent methyltransferase [Nitrospirota bacterium]
MTTLVVPANVDKYENVYRGGYDKRYPTLDLVRLEGWYFKKLPGKVLDFACGTGVNMIHLLECGYHAVGVDAAEESVKLVRRKLDARPELAARADVLRLDPNDRRLPFADNEFDYVICMSVLSLLESKERIEILVDEFHRILKPGGKMIVDINGPASDFATKGRFVADDIFEYALHKDQEKLLRCYCPKTAESFAALFKQFVVDDLGHVSFKYCNHDSYEFIACVHKPV